MEVTTHPDAAPEYRVLPVQEQKAMDNALRKLEALGEQLGFPHSSAVLGSSAGLRELRPPREEARGGGSIASLVTRWSTVRLARKQQSIQEDLTEPGAWPRSGWRRTKPQEDGAYEDA